MRKNIRFYEEEILDSIQKIEKYISYATRDAFEIDDEKFDACCMRLQHIGECGIKLEELAGSSYKNIPFSLMKGLRNRISHDYAGIDEIIVWNTIQESLPELKKALKR